MDMPTNILSILTGWSAIPIRTKTENIPFFCIRCLMILGWKSRISVMTLRSLETLGVTFTRVGAGDGKYICVDSSMNNDRQMYLVDVSNCPHLDQIEDINPPC